MDKYEWYVLHVRTDCELDIANVLGNMAFQLLFLLKIVLSARAENGLRKHILSLQAMFSFLCDTAGQNTTL